LGNSPQVFGEILNKDKVTTILGFISALCVLVASTYPDAVTIVGPIGAVFSALWAYFTNKK